MSENQVISVQNPYNCRKMPVLAAIVHTFQTTPESGLGTMYELDIDGASWIVSEKTLEEMRDAVETA